MPAQNYLTCVDNLKARKMPERLCPRFVGRVTGRGGGATAARRMRNGAERVPQGKQSGAKPTLSTVHISRKQKTRGKTALCENGEMSH